MTASKVAVFLCECGPILKSALDMDALQRRVSESPGVHSVERYPTLCSEDGRKWLADAIRASDAERWVVAACSPREHETTFRKACEAGGRNPFLLAIANVREHSGWVSSDVSAATDKAAALVRAAVARAAHQVPLERREIDANPDVVVIGAGVAGLSAARLLARSGRRVTLVERDPVIGGRAARLSDLFPSLECASCAIEPLLDEVLHHDNISVLTYSEVEEVLGYFGNFQVKVKKKARRVDPNACLGMHCCQEVCPVEVPNEWEAGLATRKAIYVPYRGALPNVSTVDPDACLGVKDGSCDACVSACPFGAVHLDQPDEEVVVEAGAVVVATGSELKVAAEGAFQHPRVFSTMALERMFNSSGCTDGHVVLRDGKEPSSVALVHCADSDGTAPAVPCSRICCMSLAKHARLLRDKLPNASITVFQWDSVVGGKGFRQFARAAASDAGAEVIRLSPGEKLRLEDDAGRARVVLERGEERQARDFDMVVMAPPLGGASGAEQLADQLRVVTDELGFMTELNDRLRSFSSRIEGVLLAGSAQGPKDIEEASAHGAAAAGATLGALVLGEKLVVEAARAEVRAPQCGGCHTCVPVCPFKAIVFETKERVAHVNDLLCRGCGACVAACPSGAIVARGFTDEQILAEVEALVG